MFNQKKLIVTIFEIVSREAKYKIHSHSSNTDWVIGWNSKINPLINPLVKPVNTEDICADKIYYYKFWDTFQRGYIPNIIFIVTELLAEIVKLTP